MQQEERNKLMAVLDDRFTVTWDDERQGSVHSTTIWDTQAEAEYEYSKNIPAKQVIALLLREEQQRGLASGRTEVQYHIKKALDL